MFKEIEPSRIEPEEAVKLLQGELHPSELASLKLKLAGEYFFCSGQMDLCDKKEREFNLEWDSGKGNKDTEAMRKRVWKMTEWGLKQTLLKNEMRRIDRLTSAITTKLRTAEMELKMNQ